MNHLLLILIGGPTVMGGTFAVASYLVRRGNDAAGREAAVIGEYEAATAEAARQASVQHTKEPVR